MVQFWTIFAAAFLASAVEFVEAFTIVLVIGVTVNWRSSFVGMGAALVALAVIVGVFGVGLIRVIPIEALRLMVGVLLLLFGLKWLKKALLRYAGLRVVHDEEAIYEAQLEELKAKGIVGSKRLDPFGVVTSFWFAGKRRRQTSRASCSKDWRWRLSCLRSDFRHTRRDIKTVSRLRPSAPPQRLEW